MQSFTRHLPSDQSITALIGKNTFFGIVASIVQVATRLVTVPIVISHLGLGGFGIWSVLLTTIAYMRFGSVGIKNAFQKYVAEATGTGNYDLANKLLSTGSAGLLSVSIAALVPIALFSVSIAKAAGIPPEFVPSSARAISMLAVIIVLSNGAAAYEAIVFGAHRIDLIRKWFTITSVIEAGATIAVLHLGYGIFAMASILGISEVLFVGYCYILARRVLPQVEVARKHISKAVVREIVRFAGSYQLLNLLQLAYGAIVPIAILRGFGANAAGVYGVASRLLSPVSMCQSAFLLPLLSGATMVYASGANQKMGQLLRKSFKVTGYMTILPLTIMSVFGSKVVFVWTGRTDPQFNGTVLLISIATLFQTFALLGLVLYRVSGRALMDNVREATRIAAVIPVAIFAAWLGFYGVLAGLAVAEFVGLVIILSAVAKTFDRFCSRDIIQDVLRVFVASTIVVAMGTLAGHFFLPLASSSRLAEIIRLTVSLVVVGVLSVPAFYLTGAVSIAELRSARDIFKIESISVLVPE